MSGPLFGLVSPCGWGNLGDAAIQESAIHGLRCRFPDARFVGFTLNPDDTTRRHGIPAFPISGVASPRYGVVLPKVPASRLDQMLGSLESLRGGYRLGHGARALLSFVEGERLHAALIRDQVPELSGLVVSGGGQIDGLWGGPWGHPFSLWQWSRVAARRSIPYVILSVGAGMVGGTLSRWFLRGALRQATYRSFRDARSRDIAASLVLGVEPGPVVPDLAFGYDMPVTPAPGRSPTFTVGVSPIAFRDPRVWPEPDAVRYEQYLGALTTFVQQIVSTGREVVLFTTDTADTRVVSDLCTRVRSPAVRTAETPTLAALADVLSRVQVVVASRLHGVLLSHVAGRPVFALSYDWKVDRHMEDLGQGAHRHSIDEPNSRAWLEGLERLIQVLPDATAAIARGVGRARQLVQNQFATVPL